jgi:putative spermidine/putrescine transport system permease protein/spermidine/putrescine transport system permease protein
MSRRLQPLDWALGAVAAAGFAVLYAPVLTVCLFSFFEPVRRRGHLSLGPFSLDTYGALAGNGEILGALGLTLGVGAAATLLAVGLGLMFALYYTRTSGIGRHVMQAIIFLPFLLPPIITGLALLIFFREIDLARGLLTIVVGHVVFIVPVVYRTLLVRLQSLSRSLTEASYDLGASAFQTLRLVLLPQLRPALVTSALLAFAVSFDETLITLFLASSEPTLPLRLWSMMRLGFVPEINALATLILVFAGFVTLVISRLQARAGSSQV